MWTYYALLLAYWVLGRLPCRVTYGIARLAADTSYLLRADIRRNVQANMRQVLGDEASERQVRTAAREVVRNAARYYADLIRMPHLDLPRFCERYLTLEGLSYLQEAVAGDRGAVLASAHFGNPEISLQPLALGIQVLALTEPLNPPQLMRLTQRLRAAHGHIFLPVSLNSAKEAVRRLKSGGIVAILVDRDIQGHGLPVPLCGRPTPIPAGAVELATRTGADLVPCFVHRERGFRYHAQIGPPVPLVRSADTREDLRVNCANLMARFEEHLCADPGQWVVLESVWPEHRAAVEPSSQAG
ncbi:MAG: lysophospholipid acyltransferase family protein [Dehalococcoidia bacterium]|jgi:KDO2-lipid IV(A) lauroyltransferase